MPYCSQSKITAMRSCLLILSIIFCLNANAQITKGSTLLGGSLSFNSNTNQGSSLNVSAQFGKAYKDNGFHGFQIGYSYAKHIDQIWNFYSFGIFYRKYIPIIKEFYFFGEINFNLGYAKLTSKSSNPTATNRTNIYRGTISLMPGLSYAVNSKLHLEIAFSNIASLHYERQIDKYTGGPAPFSTTHNNFGFNTSTQLNSFSNIQFGFRLLLQKKKV